MTSIRKVGLVSRTELLVNRVVYAIVTHRFWDAIGITSHGIRQFLLAGVVVSLALDIVGLIFSFNFPDWWFYTVFILTGATLYSRRPPATPTWNNTGVYGFVLGTLGLVAIAESSTPDLSEPLNLLGFALLIGGGHLVRSAAKARSRSHALHAEEATDDGR